MLNFKTKSSKGHVLLKCNDKLFSRTKFAVNDDNEIKKCYWLCISAHKGCKEKINYCIDLAVAGAGHNGMGAGIYDVEETEHNDEYCPVTRTEIVHKRARNKIMEQAVEGQLIMKY
jgi:hypothetical protein